MQENSIEIRNLNFSYNPEERVIKDLDFAVPKGDFVAIIGGNGSGKSTLMKLILGELQPDTGTVEVLGRDIRTYNSYKEIGYVPQMSVVEKIAFPITVAEMVVLNLYEDMGFIKIPTKENKEKVDQVIDYMGLGAYRDRPVNELSGGLQQRSMIARAMINSPDLLILDEPTAGVDKENREDFLKSIQMLNDDRDLTIVLVTHEIKEVLEYTKLNTIYEISDGELEKREASEC